MSDDGKIRTHKSGGVEVPPLKVRNEERSPRTAHRRHRAAAVAVAVRRELFGVGFARWIRSNDPFDDPVEHYRIGGESGSRFFWLLEQIDRNLRPGVWQPVWTLPNFDGPSPPSL